MAVGKRAASPEARAGSILTIDLGAIAANYRELASRVRPAACAGVVKADAYGLGMARVAPALAAAGCRDFFVAHLDEGMALRRILGGEAAIAVLHGPPPGTGGAFVRDNLIPVLNSAAQAQDWAAVGPAAGSVMLQVDTGMGRLGVPEAELPALPELDLCMVMSHLACADEPDHLANAEQRAAFERLRRRWPGVPASLAASSGIFLGQGFHADMVRPGAALYGVAPSRSQPALRPVVRLQARVIQTRRVGAGAGIGYGHSWRAAGAATIATIAAGYADGLPRSGSSRGCAWLGDMALPVVGRVSMDSITLDASAAPAGSLEPGALVDVIGPRRDINEAAADCGTIAYEILTGLGRRAARRYVGG